MTDVLLAHLDMFLRLVTVIKNRHRVRVGNSDRADKAVENEFASTDVTH